MNENFTVADLIERLKTLPPEAAVGRVGHFGEFHSMHPTDFNATTAWIGERLGKKTKIGVLNIDPPDIGSDPD